MLKRMILMLIGTALLFGLIFGYKAVGNHFMNQFFDNMPTPPATITANEVVRDRWVDSIPTIGNFRPVNGAMIPAQIDGEIKSIRFNNGDIVEQGQVLFILDDRVEQAERERLAAALAIAETEAARLEPLFARQEVSESELRRQQSQVAQARAALAMQDAMIERKTIRAPFSGVAGLRLVNLGQYVTPGSELVSIQSFDPIYLNFTLPERFLSDIVRGQTISAEVDAYPSERFSGEIRAIEPSVRESTRTIQIQAQFENPEQKLRAGMFARVRIDSEEARDVLMIPRTAIQFNPFGNIVFMIEEEGDELIVQQRLVRTGQSRGDMVEITEGLEEGDRVASSGLLKLRNGAVVKINDDPELQPATSTDPQPANR
ncbi:MAG: efflux RND transporter periplasmic adaptor subunit [Aliidiomarina sp.]|uniref:efflux RND transporter periplasmic adaptor subunit n=1 Tax=Aliidiomarina sp. TaxID=1872439 RepID=UPI0025BB58A5|nr:efflux RND transporter periplasmic adaptor subunit [Aliidiomarina sp.]MCH8501172.1 efflux RND transporter periplasmic adaptor subunit [Aliidiomarina sp.]